MNIMSASSFDVTVPGSNLLAVNFVPVSDILVVALKLNKLLSKAVLHSLVSRKLPYILESNPH